MESIEIFTQAAIKIKALIEDYNKKSPKIIIDFHKIKWEFSNEIMQDLTDIYKKLVNMINLMKNFAKDSDVKDNTEGTESEK